MTRRWRVWCGRGRGSRKDQKPQDMTVHTTDGCFRGAFLRQSGADNVSLLTPSQLAPPPDTLNIHNYLLGDTSIVPVQLYSTVSSRQDFYIQYGHVGDFLLVYNAKLALTRGVLNRAFKYCSEESEKRVKWSRRLKNCKATIILITFYIKRYIGLEKKPC